MEFDLTSRQRQIRQAAREFAEGELRSIAHECDVNEDFPRELVKKAGSLGLLGSFVKREYGGLGLGFLEHAIILEEFWRIDPGLGQVLSSVTFGAEEIQIFGSEEQKKKYIPPLVKGEWMMGFSVTEPEAGSDVASAATIAARDADYYVINGTKVMITNGTVANFILAFCLTNPEEKKKSKRHSIILIETDRPGYRADRIHGKMGIRASDTANIYFENVRVPVTNLIGREGEGFVQLMTFFDHSRAYVAAHGVGLAQGALEQTIDYVKRRKQFGQPLASFQVTRFKIAEMFTMIETARTLVHKACWSLDRGIIDSRLSAMAKWWACNVAVRVVDEALQLHGGYGYIGDYPIERFYRSAKILEIYEGTKEVEKIAISRRILGAD